MKRALRFTDAEMIRGLVSGDEEILRAYYGYYYKSIRHFVLSNHGHEEDAQDLFQDVLLVIFQKARNESFILKCSLGTYLYSVSKLLWLKELEKKKRISNRPLEMEEYVDTELDVLEIADYNKRLHIYRQHFEKLSSDCRKVLTLFLEGHNIAEITAIMGYKSDQHTRNRRYRCKLSLINKIRCTSDSIKDTYGYHKKN